MKLITKYYIFGHCWNMLCRQFPLGLKTFKILDCTGCADSDESHKPCKALYKNRQSGIIHESFANFLAQSTHRHGVLLINTLKRAFPDKGKIGYSLRLGIIATTNKRCGATSSPKPKRYTATETTADRFKGLLSYLQSIGGKGANFFTSLYLLPHSGRVLTLNI